MHQAVIEPFGNATPRFDESCWIAPTATVIGAVVLGPDANIWYGAVLRADSGSISVGPRSNVQDGVVIHADPGFPVTIGAEVSVGHNAVVHGCTIGNGALIGMGAVLMNGAQIGAGSLIAAGALVPEGMQIPPRSLVAGLPGRVRRLVTDEEVHRAQQNAARYVDSAALRRLSMTR